MLDSGSSLCKPFDEIAAIDNRIKLHITKVSLVQSINVHDFLYLKKELSKNLTIVPLQCQQRAVLFVLPSK